MNLLLDEACSAAPDLSGDLLAIWDQLHGAVPLDLSRIADACVAVADWAVAAGRPITASAYAEMAAAIFPNSARRAWIAARVNRQVGLGYRAEPLYHRAILLSRWHERWKTYVRARLGLGRMEGARGNTRLAMAHYRAASKAAWKYTGERWLAAQCQHDLLALAAERGDFRSAEEHARRAFEYYPKHNQRFPACVHDFAFLLVRQGRYREAIPLLERVMSADIPVVDRIIGWGSLAHAYGAAGDEEGFRSAEAKVVELAGTFEVPAAAAYINLGFGARGLGQWDLARFYARKGLAISTQHQYAAGIQIGGQLVCELDAGIPGQAEAVSREGSASAALAELADSLSSHLAAWRGPSWKRKWGSGPDSLGLV